MGSRVAALRHQLAHARWAFGRARERFADWSPEVGRPAALAVAASGWLGACARVPRGRGPLWSVRLPGYRYPVHYREGTSDLDVIRGVLVRHEYRCVGTEPDVRFIVDLGANIGCTTFYLLHRYPAARAVVVEPDGGNLAVCRRNLAPFAGRVTFLRAGVWPESTGMVVQRGAYRDGAEWSFQVRPARTGEPPDFRALTVADVLRAAGFPRADVLKVDIEAAEAEVFRTGADRWLPRVRTLVIELHGPGCEAVVTGALAGYRVAGAFTDGELTVFRGIGE